MNLSKHKFTDKKSMSTLKDPFSSDKIVSIHFNVYAPGVWRPNGDFRARVEFANGATEGTQKIEAESFPSLCQKVQDFIDSLEDK